MIPIIIHTIPLSPETPFPTDACQDFFIFLRRSEFDRTIRVSHAFLLNFWGVWGTKPPENFRGFSGYFTTFSYVKVVI